MICPNSNIQWRFAGIITDCKYVMYDYELNCLHVTADAFVNGFSQLISMGFGAPCNTKRLTSQVVGG